MKTEIRKQTESETLKSYPIKGKLDGWYFRVIETSNNAWEAEGSDLWGRKMQCSGADPVIFPNTFGVVGYGCK